MRVEVPACLTARVAWDGVREALGWTDGRLVRPGAHWLVAREGQAVVSYPPWDEDSSALGAVAATASGDYAIAVIPGPLEADGSYRGDLCIALDTACGSAVGKQVLDCASAVYQIHQPLAGEDVFFLSAGQGQDRALSLSGHHPGR